MTQILVSGTFLYMKEVAFTDFILSLFGVKSYIDLLLFFGEKYKYA